MDILDPLASNDKQEDVIETKVMLNEVHIKGQAMDSDEEENIDHNLSPQTFLETQGESEVQYSLRSPEGSVITYRVLHVDDNNAESIPSIVTTGSPAYSNTAVPQVLTSNVNGQLYVIGTPNEVFTNQAGTRAIAPRSSIVETNNSVVSSIRRRDERRRATHNEVERRRRDKINNWISKLAAIIPESPPNEIKGTGHYDGLSKGGILAKACDYILELKEYRDQHESLSKNQKDLQQTVEVLKTRNESLEQENKELKAILKKNGILYVPNDVSS